MNDEIALNVAQEGGGDLGHNYHNFSSSLTNEISFLLNKIWNK